MYHYNHSFDQLQFDYCVTYKKNKMANIKKGKKKC